MRFSPIINSFYNPVLFNRFNFYFESYWPDGNGNLYMIERMGGLLVNQANAGATQTV